MFSLSISCLTTSSLPWCMGLTFQVPMQYCLYSIRLYFHLQSPPQMSTVPLRLCRFTVSGAISKCHLLFPSSILDIFQPGGRGTHLPVLYLFVFSFSPWSSHGKNTGVSCSFPFQWTTFCQSSSLWPIHLWWPCTAWLIASFHKPFCHKAVIREGDSWPFKTANQFFF